MTKEEVRRLKQGDVVRRVADTGNNSFLQVGDVCVVEEDGPKGSYRDRGVAPLLVLRTGERAGLWSGCEDHWEKVDD